MTKYVEENKETFISDMYTLLHDGTREFSDITSMHYIKENTTDEEWLYVNYGFSQKRISITADSCASIIRDFLKRIDDAPWLMDSKYITFTEET